MYVTLIGMIVVTAVSRVCREWCEKQKIPVCSSYVDKNALLMREVRGEGLDWSKGDSNTNNHALQQWYAEEHL